MESEASADLLSNVSYWKTLDGMSVDDLTDRWIYNFISLTMVLDLQLIYYVP